MCRGRNESVEGPSFESEPRCRTICDASRICGSWHRGLCPAAKLLVRSEVVHHPVEEPWGFSGCALASRANSYRRTTAATRRVLTLLRPAGHWSVYPISFRLTCSSPTASIGVAACTLERAQGGRLLFAPLEDHQRATSENHRRARHGLFSSALCSYPNDRVVVPDARRSHPLRG